MESIDNKSASVDSVEVTAILRHLWVRKRVVAVVIVLACAIGLSFSLLSTPWYRAEVTMLPAGGDDPQGVTAQLARMVGDFGITGLGVGVSNRAEPLAVLKSKQFAQEFIEQQGLLETILAQQQSHGWRWLLPREAGDADMRDAVRYFDTVVREIVEDRKTGMVTVRIEWPDPNIAAEWANLMPRRLNDSLRARAIADAERNLDYLTGELTSANVIGVRESTGRLIQAELQKLMIARGSEEYAFRVVDVASVPKGKIRPRLALILPATLLLGFLLGAAIALARPIFGSLVAAKNL